MIEIKTITEKKEFLDAFLNFHSAKTKYYTNLCGENVFTLLSSSSYRDIFSCSFYWADTQEGHGYWSNLSNEWYKLFHLQSNGTFFIEDQEFFQSQQECWDD